MVQPTTSSPARATRVLARRSFADSRVRNIAFAYLFAIMAYIQPAAYRNAYPHASDRLALARSFGENKAVRLFYGVPHDLLTVSGYSAWRVGGTLAIFAAVWGLLAAVRALRAEEDAGRAEAVLAGIVTRGGMFIAAVAAMTAGAFVLWLAIALGSIIAGLPLGGSLFLALAVVSVAPVCAGAVAVVCQFAATRRVALELGGAVIAAWFLLRVVADTANGVGWLRWLTPLGWAEEMRPFTGAHPAVLLLPLLASVLLFLLAGRLSVARDVGRGIVNAPESRPARLRLLSSPGALALRLESGSLVVWFASVGAFAFIVGIISTSISASDIPAGLRREIEKLGSGSILTPGGYMAFVFIFFVLIVGLFCCAQVGGARHEEAGGELETLLALPVGRVGWLASRLGLAVVAAALLALLTGALAWAGAAAGGAHVAFGSMIGAGANALPSALLFLGLAAAVYAAVPRAGAAVSYGLIVVAFLWQLFGALLGAPSWLVKVSPFAHVAAVPNEPFRTEAALVMLAVGAAAAGIALAVFRRRDLSGA